MLSFEAIFQSRKELVLVAKKTLAQQIDIIEGCRLIYSLWEKAGLEIDNNYYYFTGVVSETDKFVKGDIRKNFSKEYLFTIDEEEKKFIIVERKHVEEMCRNLVDTYSV